MWIIVGYFFLTIGVAISAFFHAGTAGLYVFIASFLFLVAGGGIKSMVLYGDRNQKIAGPIVGLLVGALAYWLSTGFSVQLFGIYMSAAVWGAIGFLIAIVFAPRRLAEL
jgi:hypothetical protein